jgi:hypothetical protein
MQEHRKSSMLLIYRVIDYRYQVPVANRVYLYDEALITLYVLACISIVGCLLSNGRYEIFVIYLNNM